MKKKTNANLSTNLCFSLKLHNRNLIKRYAIKKKRTVTSIIMEELSPLLKRLELDENQKDQISEAQD